MNLFGFLAVLVICGVSIIITLLILRHRYEIFMIENTLRDKQDISQKQFGFEKDISKDNKEDKDNTLDTEQIATVSMDEVIKAANKLMGVETLEEDNNAK